MVCGGGGGGGSGGSGGGGGLCICPEHTNTTVIYCWFLCYPLQQQYWHIHNMVIMA